MTLSLPSFADKLLIGNDAGWALTFHKETKGLVDDKAELSLSRSDYYATIEATLPAGVEGGSYTFTVEGLTDAHYGQIAQTVPGSPRWSSCTSSGTTPTSAPVAWSRTSPG